MGLKGVCGFLFKLAKCWYYSMQGGWNGMGGELDQLCAVFVCVCVCVCVCE